VKRVTSSPAVVFPQTEASTEALAAFETLGIDMRTGVRRKSARLRIGWEGGWGADCGGCGGASQGWIPTWSEGLMLRNGLKKALFRRNRATFLVTSVAAFPTEQVSWTLIPQLSILFTA
jgi:hypothetical protein